MMNGLRIESDTLGCKTLWLNRPEKRNALNEGLLRLLLAAAQDLSRDESAKVVVLRSSSAMFCAGADLNDWTDVSPREAQRLSALGSQAFQALADIPVPVVAVLEGAALGGGLELALACDIRIGTDACRVGFPEPRLGNSPAWGGMARLVNLAGVGTARDMLLTGDVISASDAFKVGILQRLCSVEELPRKLKDLLTSVLACDVGTLSYIKSLLGSPSQIVAAQEAAIAGFTATRPESRERKEMFLASRRNRVGGQSSTKT
jgi:enoyl-CoA hydratase/carnithine racemase